VTLWQWFGVSPISDSAGKSGGYCSKHSKKAASSEKTHLPLLFYLPRPEGGNYMRILMIGLFLCLCTPLALAQASEVNTALERGYEAFQLGRYQQAAFEYQAALAWPGPHAARAHFNRGVCLFRMGKTQAAIEEYQQALDLRAGRDAAAAYALGVAWQATGDHAKALSAFRQALSAAAGNHVKAQFG
jgi:tetratricopeptide (TPR) repeat protein